MPREQYFLNHALERESKKLVEIALDSRVGSTEIEEHNESIKVISAIKTMTKYYKRLFTYSMRAKEGMHE